MTPTSPRPNQRSRPEFVLVYNETCNSGKAGTVALKEMNSESYDPDTGWYRDNFDPGFLDCMSVDPEDAKSLADSKAKGGHGAYNRKAGKNALQYFSSKGVV